MIGTIYTTDPAEIKFLQCDPAKPRILSFDGCNLKISEGTKTLETIPLCSLNIPQESCGGSIKKSITIQPNSNYTLVSPEIADNSGFVQMILVKIKYLYGTEPGDMWIQFEYKGWQGIINNFMILTGRTPGNGWDMNDISGIIPASPFDPHGNPDPGSPDLSFGGILFTNPSLVNPVQLDILIFN